MTAEAEGREAAARFRHDHRLGVQPLGDLVSIVEQASGIDVAVLDVGPDEHGLTMRDPARDSVVIGVARTNRPMRQRSTLAHELAHVLFEDWADEPERSWSERRPEEVRADAFARHLLIPVDGLREFLGNRDRGDTTLVLLSQVVQRFLVSPAIAAIALEQAGYLAETMKATWMTLTTPLLASRFGWIDQYRALETESDRRRAPQRLLARAINGYQERVVSAQTLATLRGVSVATVEAELCEAGIEPREPPVLWTDSADLPDVDIDPSDLDDLDDLDDEPSGTTER
ncbi:ImmA/IrrE family metallo-endopeptidase [Pseudofrankia sp. BMG5.36]|uniref:ImmA/IrrE family metallo-endopeptidase n=1 Tax=Pseudofrankia sp. BMG5.36 TaxID=1834512 RepID=UPI0008D91491|nr:ImmA/IrrE family metallo-endopeptidase [Pseudofrankia sp. BMG5.36]OHV48905.1 toxin-antitoxin system, toxin component [Pseudofrankia sp. BMG5.36]